MPQEAVPAAYRIFIVEDDPTIAGSVAEQARLWAIGTGSVLRALALFAVIFLLLHLNALRQIRLANPIGLLLPAVLRVLSLCIPLHLAIILHDCVGERKFLRKRKKGLPQTAPPETIQDIKIGSRRKQKLSGADFLIPLCILCGLPLSFPAASLARLFYAKEGTSSHSPPRRADSCASRMAAETFAARLRASTGLSPCAPAGPGKRPPAPAGSTPARPRRTRAACSPFPRTATANPARGTRRRGKTRHPP